MTDVTKTWIDEVRALALDGVLKKARRKNTKSAERWTDVFLARYTTPVGGVLTLESVGSMFSLTRERVRQICFGVLAGMRDQTDNMPITSEILRQVAQRAPISESQANEDLRHLLGDGIGVLSVLAFAHAANLPNVSVCLGKSKLQHQGQSDCVKMLIAGQAPEWVHSALVCAREDSSAMGCTNLIRIAGLLALDGGTSISRDALIGVLSAAPGFIEIDAAGGWFTYRDVCVGSPTALRVKKILAVATEPVSIDEIASALITDDIWLSRERVRGLSIPPLHILRDLVSLFPWAKCIQHNRVIGTEVIGLDILSDTERLAVAVIDENDGIACRHQITDRLCADLGVSAMGVNAMLGSSPVILKCEHGLYGLRGRRIGGQALSQARNRMSSVNVLAKPDEAHHDLGDCDFMLRVTESSLRHEQYNVPAHLRDRLTPGKLMAYPDGQKGRMISIGSGGVIRGVNVLFPQVVAGDAIVVQIKGDDLHLRMNKA